MDTAANGTMVMEASLRGGVLGASRNVEKEVTIWEGKNDFSLEFVANMFECKNLFYSNFLDKLLGSNSKSGIMS